MHNDNRFDNSNDFARDFHDNLGMSVNWQEVIFGLGYLLFAAFCVYIAYLISKGDDHGK